MRISTRTRYGARALTHLAAAFPDRAVPLREVAERQRVSLKYLEQIMSALKAAGLVRARRGAGGGYELARPPGEIRLSKVFAVLEGSPAPMECVQHPGACPMETVCPTRDTWVQVEEAILGVLDATTLQHLAERKRKKAAGAAPKCDT